MKLLIATPLLPSQSGGPAQYAVGLKQSLETKGCASVILAFQEVAQYPSGTRHIILFFKALSRLQKVDGVIVLDTLSMALPVSIAAFFARKKIIVRTGGDFVWEHYVERTKTKTQLSKFYTSRAPLSLKERFALWLQKKVIIPLTDVFVFSTTWQWDIWKLPYDLSNKNVKIIENAYTPHVPVNDNYLNRKDSHTVVWVGRKLALKNTEMLDEAIHIVKNNFPEMDYKKYTGLPHEEVIDVLSKSRLIVIPSLSEVSPNLALEALALGVPVLLTRDCGMKDTLDGVVTWIDPLSVENIADNIGMLMNDREYEKAVTKMNSFKKTRTYDQVAEEFLALFQ